MAADVAGWQVARAALVEFKKTGATKTLALASTRWCSQKLDLPLNQAIQARVIAIEFKVA